MNSPLAGLTPTALPRMQTINGGGQDFLLATITLPSTANATFEGLSSETVAVLASVGNMMLTQISVPADTTPTADATTNCARATPLLSVLPTVKLLERLAELQVEAELEGAQCALARVLCTEIETRLPEVTAGLNELFGPGSEPTASYIETLLVFAERALDARDSYLAAVA